MVDLGSNVPIGPYIVVYRQDPNLGEDKDGLLGPKKDKYKECSLLDKAHPNFWVQAAETANSATLLDIKTKVRAQCGHG